MLQQKLELSGKELCREEPVRVGGRYVEHKPEMCLPGKGSQMPPRLPQAQCSLQTEKDVPSPLLSPKETHLDCWLQCWAPQYRKDMGKLKCVQLRATRMIKRLGHLTGGARLKVWGCSALRREDSGRS